MVEVLEHDRDELLDTRHPPAGQWESSDQEEEPAWQRSPSLDIDDEDTDELFGGGLYKSRKLKETILLNEQELQRNGTPFYKPDLLRGIDEESSCEESEGTSENRRTPQPVIAAHNLLREQGGCATPKTGTEQDAFVCDTPEPTDEDRPGLHRSRSAPLPVLLQLSTTTSSGNPNAISTNSSSHHLSADMLPSALAVSHSDSTKRNSSHGLTPSASFSNNSSNNNSDYFSSMLTRRASNAGATDEFSERMRTAAVMLAQLAEQSKRDVGGRRSGASKSSSAAAAINKGKLEEIRERIIREMMALEEERMLRVNAEGVPVNGGGSGGEGGGGEMIEDERDLMNVVKKDKDDPSGKCRV